MAKLIAPKIGLSIPISITFLVMSALIFYPVSIRPHVAFHQDFIEGNYSEIQNSSVDVNDINQVFNLVFSSLRDEVKVYPTENYYYFVFKNHGRQYWGNIHFPPAMEMSGYFDFAYWNFENDPEKAGKPEAHFKKFTQKEGVVIKELSFLKYSVSYQGRSVIFSFNDLSKKVSPEFSLNKDEVVAERTFDESGHKFFLIFNKSTRHFMFVLDEQGGSPEVLVDRGGGVLVGQETGFAFYQEEGRKILMAVNLDNVRRNNYFDGPFDQLGDNFISGDDFSRYLQEAYPYAKGKIDRYGRFVQADHSRLAITPYRFYSNLKELPAIINECKGKDFYGCITYDSKEASSP